MNKKLAGISVMLMLISTVLWADGFAFLPQELQDQLAEVEESRAAWEDRKQEVRRQLSIQPFEQDSEFAERVARAESRGAGREERYLQFQLNELSLHEQRVPRELIQLSAAPAPSLEYPFMLEIRSDLGMLPEIDSFSVPLPRPGNPGDEKLLEEAIAAETLSARITYRVTGTPYAEYSLELTSLLLTDSASAAVFQPVSLSRSYRFTAAGDFSIRESDTSIDFADGRIPADFSLSGDSDWFVTDDHSYSGGFSLQSGTIGGHGSTTASYTGMVPQGRRLTGVSFAVRSSSEENFDSMTFAIDGLQQDAFSGQQDWTVQEYATHIEGGHSFELTWTYEKDGSVNQGQDAVWIDDIQLIYETE